MKTTSILSTLALLATVLTVMPSVSAEVPMPTDIPYCITPECSSPAACSERTYTVTADTTNTVTTNADCSIDVETGKGVICVGAWTATSEHDVGPIHWTRHYCAFPGGDPLAMSSAAIDLPDPCGPTAYCTGPECPEVDIATTDLLAYLGPHASASLSQECSANVQERGLRCAIGTSELERTVGPLTVGADVCMPGLDCTCDPLPIELASASAADIEPPVEVEFVQCVTDPCPPIVRCTEREAHVPFVTDAYIEGDCDVLVGLVDAYRICPDLHQQVRPSAGPATVVVNYCAPSLDCTCDPLPQILEVSSASLQPPIHCVMAPCGPQCIVPCVPQVVPSGCELRQATPEAARAWVWGSDASDCTVDVDPAYDCVGGWGFDRHVTAAFLDAVVRVCTGGPFPPPVVQAILEAIQLE